jgi:hypothetical protein
MEYARTKPMYDAVILTAWTLVTPTKNTSPARDTIAPAAQAYARPNSVGISLQIPLISKVIINAIATIFHRGCDGAPSEKIENKM